MKGDPGGGLLRAAVLAGSSALLTAVGHTAAGGSVPDLAVLVVLLPLLAGAFTSLARRCSSMPAIVAVLGAGQVVLHYLMELLHPAHQTAVPLFSSGAPMLAMHAAVTVATAVALAHADRALVALRRAWGRVLPRRLCPPAADRPLPVLAVPGPAIPARLARAYAVCHVRRGPPVGATEPPTPFTPTGEHTCLRPFIGARCAPAPSSRSPRRRPSRRPHPRSLTSRPARRWQSKASTQ